MAVRIRLARIGKKKVPYFRIVAVDKRDKRDGKYLDNLGTYNPVTGEIIQFHSEKIKEWIGKGALPSDTVIRITKQFEKGKTGPQPKTVKPKKPRAEKPAEKKEAASKEEKAAPSETAEKETKASQKVGAKEDAPKEKAAEKKEAAPAVEDKKEKVVKEASPEKKQEKTKETTEKKD